MRQESSTLVDAVRLRAQNQPDQTAVTFLLDGEQQEATWTYRDLDTHARAVAALLRERGAAGERALLLHPPGLEFVAALFGCFYAGVVAVPTYPPQFNLRSRSAVRLAKLVQDARPALALTTAANLGKAAWFSTKESGLGGLRWSNTDELPVTQADMWTPVDYDPESLALIQYTSGSTSQPKGVQLSHRNLLANSAVITAKFRHSAASRVVSWLPPYHDMGLIGCILHPIVEGLRLVLMAPLHALQKPLRWLQAIDRYRATTSGSPNFAYDHCVRQTTAEERCRLDLSSWQVAFNGAEPVRAETLERFTEAFRPCGFRPEAFYPCYGLAEATLFVTGGEQDQRPRTQAFDRHQLARRRAVPVPPAEGVTLVSCGQPHPSHQIALVDADTGQPCPDGQVGEIWVSGPSVADGYWGRPEVSRSVFHNRLPSGHGPYLRTGDLGFVHDGELYIAGRIKDLIIIRGRNYYPPDIEQEAEASHPALLLGSSAAFAVEIEDAEQVVIACEVRREERRQLDVAEVARAIRAAVTGALELRVYGVVLLRPGGLPRTTSGKIQRSACQTTFLEKTWEPVGEDFIAGVAAEQETPSAGSGAGDSSAPPDRAALLAASENERRSLLLQYLSLRLARILKASRHWLEPDKPLGHLGVDSLLWVELLLQIEADLEVTIAADALAPDQTLADLVELVVEKLWRPGEPDKETRKQGDKERVSDYSGRQVPLTPIQAEFLRPGIEHPDKFSTVLFLGTPAGLDLAALEAALPSLERQHDAFRLRFHRTGGGWRQEYAEAGSAVAFERLDLRGAPVERLRELHRWLRTVRPGELDVTKGPLLRATLCDPGPVQTGVLQLCLHHLVCDGLSVSICVSNLLRAYRRCLRGKPLEAPAGVPFGEWACALDDRAQTEEARHDLEYWQQTCRDLPTVWRDAPASAAAGTASWSVGPRMELSSAPRRRFVAHFTTAQEQHEAMLAALARAWQQHTGQDDLFVRLEQHGRQPLGGRTPATTVGWFICQYPFRLREIARFDDDNLVKHVAAELRRVPHHGLSHGLLTYSCRDQDVRAAMQELPAPRLGMVYYGHLHDVFREDSLFPVLEEQSYNLSRADDERWPDLLLRAGQDRGTTWWQMNYRTSCYGAESVAALTTAVGKFFQK